MNHRPGLHPCLERLIFVGFQEALARYRRADRELLSTAANFVTMTVFYRGPLEKRTDGTTIPRAETAAAIAQELGGYVDAVSRRCADILERLNAGYAPSLEMELVLRNLPVTFPTDLPTKPVYLTIRIAPGTEDLELALSDQESGPFHRLAGAPGAAALLEGRAPVPLMPNPDPDSHYAWLNPLVGPLYESTIKAVVAYFAEMISYLTWHFNVQMVDVLIVERQVTGEGESKDHVRLIPYRTLVGDHNVGLARIAEDKRRGQVQDLLDYEAQNLRYRGTTFSEVSSLLKKHQGDLDKVREELRILTGQVRMKAKTVATWVEKANEYDQLTAKASQADRRRESP